MGSQSVVTQLADELLTEDTIDQFLSESFTQAIQEKGLQPTETQARSHVIGTTFELCLTEIFTRLYPSLSFERHTDLPEAGLTGQSAPDFVFTDEFGELVGVVEAKGSPETIYWPSGEIIEIDRPGLERTDSMKKAASIGHQIHTTYDIPFYILTTHPPKGTSGLATQQAALTQSVQDIIDVTQISELTQFKTEILTSPQYYFQHQTSQYTFCYSSCPAKAVDKQIRKHGNITDIFIGSEQQWLVKDILNVSSEIQTMCVSTDAQITIVIQDGSVIIPNIESCDPVKVLQKQSFPTQTTVTVDIDAVCARFSPNS